MRGQRGVPKTLATIQECAFDESLSWYRPNPQTSFLPEIRHALSFSCEQRSTWRPQKMSVACTCINDEPLRPSLLGNEIETKVFNSIFKKPDGTSLQPDRERNPRSDARCAGRLDRRHDWPVHVCNLSSAMTQDQEPQRRPVVEQLPMTGTRLAILEQDHQKSTNNLQSTTSRAVSKSYLAGLSKTCWSEVRGRVETVK